MDDGTMGGLVAEAAGRTAEGFSEPGRGDARWVTLFSAERTPTAGMCAGLMTVAPGGGRLALHSHAPAEIYYVVAGSGTLHLDGRAQVVTAGQAAFIPGGAVHGLENPGAAPLEVFYVFPTDRFEEVEYLFA